MKTIKILALTAMTAALTACSNDDEVMSNYPSDNIVRVTASVGEAATRASYNESNLKEFYICINNSSNANYTYHGTKVTKDANNAWQTASQMLWQNATTAVDVYAFTKAQVTATCCCGSGIEASVKTDQSNATDYSSDFLGYKKTGFVPKTDLEGGYIPVTFSHLFSQLNINLTFGTEFNEGQSTGYLTANPITSIKVGGSIPSAVCDFTTASGITATVKSSASAEDVTPHQVTNSFVAASTSNEKATVQYSCILVPQKISAGNFVVTFVADGKAYVWKSSVDFTLESGHQHALNLTIGKDVVELGSFTIKPWEDAATETLATE